MAFPKIQKSVLLYESFIWSIRERPEVNKASI